MSDDHMMQILEQTLCPRCFKALLKELGGTRQYFPSPAARLRRIRNEQIRAIFRGDNLDEIAQLFNLTTRQVRNILKK